MIALLINCFADFYSAMKHRAAEEVYIASVTAELRRVLCAALLPINDILLVGSCAGQLVKAQRVATGIVDVLDSSNRTAESDNMTKKLGKFGVSVDAAHKALRTK